MKVKRYSFVLCALALLAFAAPAFAQKTGAVGPASVQVNCDLNGYKVDFETTFNPPVAIPDGVAAGVTVGPFPVPADGSFFTDVIVDLRVTHTWAGDLIATLIYDRACDGPTPDDITSTFLCRIGRATCVGGTGFGFNVDLLCNNLMLFSDGAAAQLGSTTPAPAGCYLPSGVGATPFAAFTGALKGGCFYLNMSDNAAADVGTICQLSVHSKNERPVPTNLSTWGKVKSIYR